MHEFLGADKVPLANLFVTLLNAVDIPVERFADKRVLVVGGGESGSDISLEVARVAAETGAVHHDFSDDPAFRDRADYFMDADHMNRRGAAAFSAQRLAPSSACPSRPTARWTARRFPSPTLHAQSCGRNSWPRETQPRRP